MRRERKKYCKLALYRNQIKGYRTDRQYCMWRVYSVTHMSFLLHSYYQYLFINKKIYWQKKLRYYHCVTVITLIVKLYLYQYLVYLSRKNKYSGTIPELDLSKGEEIFSSSSWVFRITSVFNNTFFTSGRPSNAKSCNTFWIERVWIALLLLTINLKC